MGHDDGHGRIAQGNAAEIERVAEANVERAREPQPLADADREDATVHEDGRARSCRRDVEYPSCPFVLKWVAVHRRKETDRAQTTVIDRVGGPGVRFGPRWIDH